MSDALTKLHDSRSKDSRGVQNQHGSLDVQRETDGCSTDDRRGNNKLVFKPQSISKISVMSTSGARVHPIRALCLGIRFNFVSGGTEGWKFGVVIQMTSQNVPFSRCNQIINQPLIGQNSNHSEKTVIFGHFTISTLGSKLKI